MTEAIVLRPRLTVDDVLARLRIVESAGNGFAARCPAHEDNRNCLFVSAGNDSAGNDGHVLLHCHAGCGFGELLSAMGVTA